MVDAPINRERIVVSARLIVPLSCCGGFNEKALRFRQSINASVSTGRLEPELAVKAVGDVFGLRKKTAEDTDNKKREFTGDTRPGVASNEFGYRWDKSAKWEPGSRLVINPSYTSRMGMGTMPNVGWIPRDENQPKSFPEMIARIQSKPHIQLRKFKVNPKTDDIIPESEKIIDPFAISSGMSMEERRNAQKKYQIDNPEEKRLPGASLESRVPGGSLLSRAAAVFGILRDENNKFRCPPGTPAANQYTDATGSNCFGFSASKFSRYAAREAAKLTAEGEYEGLRTNAFAFLNFARNDVGSKQRRGVADPEFVSRVAYWEDLYGDKFKPPVWRDTPVPENLRMFKNGAVRAQDDIARQKAAAVRIYDALGIDPNDPDAHFQAVEKLQKMHVDSGGTAGWDLKIANVSSGGDASRLTDLEVREFTEARLKSVQGWNLLSKEEQQRLIDSDVRRYQETERAMFETLLDQFMQNPSSARVLGKIEYDFFSDDEAGTGMYREAPSIVPRLKPDGTPVLDKAGNPVMGKVPGELRSVIHINMGQILANQETMLPNMGPDERLAISAVGARSEAEGRLAVADFLVNADHTARGMAGLIDGVYSFSSHIMLHEHAHSIQLQVFMAKIQEQIDSKGFISVPIVDKNGIVKGTRNVDSIYKLSGDDVMAIMTDVADDINLDSLKDAMERIKAVAPLAGAYPRDAYKEGSEVWALEVAAELHALRARGIIYGPDIDAALAFMDDIGDSRASVDRALGDETEELVDMDDVFTIRPDSVVPDDMPDESVTEALGDRDERIASALREEIKRFKAEFKDLPEDEMISEAAIIQSQRDATKNTLKKLNDFEIDPSLPDAEKDSIREYLENLKKQTQMELDFHDTRYNEASKAWRKKYGIGARGEKDRFEESVKAVREKEGLFDDVEIEELAKIAALDDLRKSVEKMPEKKIIRRLADDEIYLSTLDPSSDEAKTLIEKIDVIKEQYVQNMRDAGDKSTTAKIKKNLDQSVKDLISPPAKKNVSLKSKQEAKDHALKERRRVRGTAEQKKAVKELGDIASSDIGQLLDPASQTRAGRAINKRNARLKRLGLTIDEKSSEEGDVVQQVENLLIPVMEVIDGTSIADPFEMETVIDFDSGVLRGKLEGKEIEVPQFVSGKVLTTKTKKLDIPEKGIRNKETGKTSRRVIVQVREGDRGLFPTSGDDDQRFVAPPGRIRITGVDPDGTVRAELSYQKDSVEVIDSMAHSLETNKTDAIWAQSHGKKIKAVADKYVNSRRESGRLSSGARSDYDSVATTSSRTTVDEVIDAGGSFGEGFDELPPHLSSEDSSSRLSSGKKDVLGAPATRKQRTESRKKSMSSQIREVKSILGGGQGDSADPLSRGDIHPDVARLIADTPEEDLLARAENTAYRMHEGFDRRVRVRATDDDIERLATTGSIRSSFASPDDESKRTSRRAQRYSGMTTGERSSRLSSGRVIDSSANLAERKRQEKEVAAQAFDVFDKFLSGDRKSINDMSEAELFIAFNGKVRKSKRKSVSATNDSLYEVDDVPTAIALMMLGHHVAVKDQDLALTSQSQKAFEDLVEDAAKSHIDAKNPHPEWVKYQEEYKKEFKDLDFNDPKIVKEMEKNYVDKYQADLCALYSPAQNLLCSGHIGIDREKMPQTNGRSAGHDTVAVRALKAGEAAGKFEPLKTIKRDAAVEAEFAEELNAAVAKANAERAKKGEPELTDKEVSKKLYELVAKKHSLKNQFEGKTQQEHKADSYDKMSDASKKWLYENTDWNDTEVNLETPFIEWLNGVIEPESGKPAVILKEVNPKDYAPSQQQLVASKSNATARQIQEKAIEVAENIRADNPGISDEDFRAKYLEEIGKEWFMQPILTSNDGYILDGHHRWAGITVGNSSLPEELKLPLKANEVQTDIIEALTLGKIFQDAWGIKEARLGAENKWKEGEIADISREEISQLMDDLTKNVGTLVDAKYAGGDFIQLGSVGLSNNPDYAARAKERQINAQRDETRKIAGDVLAKVRKRGKPLHEYTPEELKEDFGDSVKPSDMKPLFTSSDPKDMAVYKVDNIGQAIALMALGHHVTLEYSSDEAVAKKQKESLSFAKTLQQEFFKDIEKMGQDIIANNEKEWLDFKEKAEKIDGADGVDPAVFQEKIKKEFLKKFGDQYKTNLCNFYDGDENVFCGNNLGIPRAKMPQAGGRLAGANTRGAELGLAGQIPIKEAPHKHVDPYGIKTWDGEKRFEGIMAKIQESPESAASISDEDRQFVIENMNWNLFEVSGEEMIKEIIRGKLGDDSIKENMAVNPDDYTPSQQELDAVQTDGMHKSLKAAVEYYTEILTKDGKYKRGTKEFTAALIQALKEDTNAKAKLSERRGTSAMMDPILATSDKLLLDGHHRWSAITVFNGEVDDDQQIPLHVDEVQTDIISGLTLTKVLQRGLGIKDAKLTGAVDFEEGDVRKVEIGERDRVLKEINDSMDDLAAEIYAEGDFIEIDSVGMRNNPAYAEEVLTRQRDALSRRAGPAARAREAELDAAVRNVRTKPSADAPVERESVGRLAKMRKGRRLSSGKTTEAPASGKTVGMSPKNYASEYYSRIGLPSSLDADMMPVSGYLVHKSHMDAKRSQITKGGAPGNLRPDAVFEVGDEDLVGDGLTALGDMEIVLRPGVSNRVAYGRGNALTSAHRPVMLNSRNREDVADAILNADGVNAEESKREALLHMLSSSLNNDFSNVNASRASSGKMPSSFDKKLPEGSTREPFEAQILGGFDVADIEQINVPFSKIEAAGAKEDISDVVDTVSIADKLRKAGFSQEEIEYFYSIGGGQSLNTASMSMLRNYRASQKMKEDLAKRGLNNVKFAHPNGFNIEDARSHSKSAKAGQSVESALKDSIAEEIIAAAKDLLKEMTKTNKPKVTSIFGGKL